MFAVRCLCNCRQEPDVFRRGLASRGAARRLEIQGTMSEDRSGGLARRIPEDRQRPMLSSRGAIDVATHYWTSWESV